MKSLKNLFESLSEANKYVTRKYKGSRFEQFGSKGRWFVDDALVASGERLPNSSFWNVRYNK